MCMGLGHDRGLVLVHPLSGDTGLTFAQKFFDFFLMEVVQNSFHNSLKARGHQSQCCAPAWGCCIDYHSSEVALELCHTWVLFFVAPVCGSARPLIC
jgi:hypothetical protein